MKHIMLPRYSYKPQRLLSGTLNWLEKAKDVDELPTAFPATARY